MQATALDTSCETLGRFKLCIRRDDLLQVLEFSRMHGAFGLITSKSEFADGANTSVLELDTLPWELPRLFNIKYTSPQTCNFSRNPQTCPKESVEPQIEVDLVSPGTNPTDTVY